LNDWVSVCFVMLSHCSTSCPPRRSRYRSFLLPTICTPRARCITRFFQSSTTFPPRRSRCRSFLSLADACPAHFIPCFLYLSMTCPPCRSLHRSFLSLADDIPAVPLAASLVSFSCRRLACRAARCITRFSLLPTSCPPCRSLHRSFFSLADVLPAAPLAELLVAFSCRLLARRATR
jgi:hypothetical protein